MAITGGRGGGGICATAYEPAAKKWNSIREAIAGYQDALQNVLVTFTSPSLPEVPCKKGKMQHLLGRNHSPGTDCFQLSPHDDEPEALHELLEMPRGLIGSGEAVEPRVEVAFMRIARVAGEDAVGSVVLAAVGPGNEMVCRGLGVGKWSATVETAPAEGEHERRTI